MGLKSSKIKFAKNVSDPDSPDLVYMNYDVGEEFNLAFSKQPHIGEVGDQIVLMQKGKLTHVVEIIDNEVKDWGPQGGKYHYGLAVKTVGMIDNGVDVSTSSIKDTNFSSLRGNTNLVHLNAIEKNNPKELQSNIAEIFKQNGETE